MCVKDRKHSTKKEQVDKLFFSRYGLSAIASHDYKHSFRTAGVAITTILSILVIVNIIGNSLVCAAIIKNRDMRYVNM